MLAQDLIADLMASSKLIEFKGSVLFALNWMEAMLGLAWLLRVHKPRQKKITFIMIFLKALDGSNLLLPSSRTNGSTKGQIKIRNKNCQKQNCKLS